MTVTPEQAQRVMAQQAALAGDIELVQAWGDEHPDESGGFWLDNSAAEDGTGRVAIVVAVVGGHEPAASLLDRVDHREQLRVVQARHTEARLREVAQEVAEQRLSGVSGVSVDIKNNRVRAYAATDEAEVELRAAAAKHEDDLLDVQHGIVVVTPR